jgi:outer membrane protein assembly factor BamA
VPDTEFDDDKATAILTINVDEGRQFLLRSVEALGVDSDTKARVIDDLDMKAGDVYSSELFERALLKFIGLQASDPNTVARSLDEKSGWVDVVLDFRKKVTCPTPDQSLPVPP